MSSISQSFKSNPMNLNDRLIPLDFKSVLSNSIPDSHQWTLSTDQDDPVANPIPSESLPLVDLSHPNAESLIRQASEEWGAFQVTNHGVPVSLLQELELQTHRLFSLPTHHKQTALRAPHSITGYGLPRISVFFPKLMWSEGFSIMGSPAHHASQLWPNQPEQQETFCNVMENYQREMKKLTERMLELMLGSMGLTLEDVKWLKPNMETQNVLQLNSYPICQEAGRVMGLAPHTDTSLLTILHQSSSVVGLHVHRESIGWVPVHPISGALVVNVGDLMHILSNGRFKSSLHRAVVNNTQHRISVGYFYGPPSDAEISPLTGLTDQDHPPLYRAVTWKEYLDAKATHFDEALVVIRNNGGEQQQHQVFVEDSKERNDHI